MSLKREKAELRARLHEVRRAIPEAERARAASAIAERLLRALDGRETVMVFLSFGSEVPTDPTCERLHAAGHRLVVPHIDGREVVPVEYEPGEVCAQAALGVREPVDLRSVDPAEMDAVVAPGLGFDRRGYRLGYGGGFYDRLLSRGRPDALRIGIGFHAQVVEEVPHGDSDRRLDMVLTDLETIVCR